METCSLFYKVATSLEMTFKSATIVLRWLERAWLDFLDYFVRIDCLHGVEAYVEICFWFLRRRAIRECFACQV